MPDSPTDLTGEMPFPGWGGTAARPDPSGRGETLPGLLSAIRQRRWSLVWTILAVPFSAFLVLQQIPPQYTATGSLIYQASDYQGTLRQDPITEATMASQAEVLQSLRIAQEVANRGDLYANPDFNASLRPPGLARRALSDLQLLLGMEPDNGTDDQFVGPMRDRARELTLVAVHAALHAAQVRLVACSGSDRSPRATRSSPQTR